ncbi:ComEC/Rec2 family competence protein [Antarcticirhabdus aurantiaca]|uniref:ComEC/Rec2 family competence protein n=1 Tax=Antarcticirhabdus aurantiaca TaxID=2606717 RepID=A0ACD4NVG0_9HYPH|nr:ComEC/Rec2 family competence protein [Antarcticirhabdus aurantiaca]WAJ30885.1 ComEC/Rec2 family competence protein [Jeongeuplla avenae]
MTMDGAQGRVRWAIRAALRRAAPVRWPTGSDVREWLRRQFEREDAALTAFHAVPLGLMIGIAGLHSASSRPSFVVPLIVLVALLAALSLLRARPGWHLAALIACSAAAGASLAALELHRTHTTVLSGGAITRIEGRVEWRETDERGRSRYLVRIDETRQPVLSRPPERARILVAARHEPIVIGGSFSGLVRLAPPSGPALPGSYDFAFAPYFSGIGAIGFALGAPDEPAASTEEAGLAERLAALRLGIAERIRASIGGAEGAVAAALVTGLRAGIPEAIEDDLRVTGLAHVLSISGYHMVLVAGFVMVGMRAALALVPVIVLTWPVKKIAAGTALVAAALYLAIAGDNVATDRSFIMLAVMLAAVMLDRPALTLRNVSIAAIIVLAMQPHSVFTASFQMSFAATAALVGIYGAHSRRREPAGLQRDERGWIGRAIQAVLALALASLIAGIATAPFGAYHFGRVAPFGIVANLLLMPVFSLWIMPAALIAMLLMPFGLDPLVWQFVGVGLGLVFDLAHRIAVLLPDAASGSIGLSALLLLTAAVLAAAMLASALRWIALPLTVAGLALASRPAAPPELLIYEDGKQLALVGLDASLSHLQARPNRFVEEQWRRALGSPDADKVGGFDCRDGICRATTRSGLRVAWTEDYEKTGDLCDLADIAIVARATLTTSCRSGAALATLRTLRRTGSLAFRTGPDGRPDMTAAIPWEDDHPRDPWNAHRAEPWPERWIRPVSPSTADGAPAASDASTTPAIATATMPADVDQ